MPERSGGPCRWWLSERLSPGVRDGLPDGPAANILEIVEPIIEHIYGGAHRSERLMLVSAVFMTWRLADGATVEFALVAIASSRFACCFKGAVTKLRK